MITNVDTIKEAARIEDVVSDFVALKQSGANLVGLCPFHNERTPSFSVSPARGIFKCFGCGKGGDSIVFLKENGMDFVEAMKHIAKKYNIEIAESENGQPNPEAEKKAHAMATATVLQAHFAFDSDSPGQKYWHQRGITPQTLDEFGVGWCDGTKPAHVPNADLEMIGAINDGGNLIFYKRSTIPLHDPKGNVVGWAGRASEAENKAKYLNSPNTVLYNKSTNLFNLHRAAPHIKKSGEVWIVEGYADAMAAWQSGICNVVALCGTALTDAHVKQLKRFNGDKALRIVLAFDNETTKPSADEAGRAYKTSVALAYFSAMEKLLSIGEVFRFVYPKGKKLKDIADVVAAKIDPASCEQREAIEDYVEQKLFSDDWGKNASAVQKADFQEHIATLISRIPRDSVRDIFIKKLYELLELSPKKFSDLVSKYCENKQEAVYDINEHEYLIVKDEIKQRYPFFDEKTKELSWRYQTIKKSTLTDQFGTAILKTLPRFTKAIIKPDHLGYCRTLQQETDRGTFRFFNDYEPLPFTPKPFTLPPEFAATPYGYDYAKIPEIKNISMLMRHIFGTGKNSMGDDYLQIAWDWLAILYLHPEERLPAIGLVSKEEGTGKSTLINVFAKIFGLNASKIDSSRIAAKFNALLGGKVLVYCEETKDDRGQMENVLKDLITGYEAVIEKKFGDAEVVPTFCKFLFASNHPDTFMKIGTKSTRFFVTEVAPIPKENKVPNFEDLCYLEIPYLLYFLQKRGVMIPYEDRLWMKPERYENEALIRLRQSSKDNVERNIEEMMEAIFLGLQHTSPVMSFTSREVMRMMISFAGKRYENYTVNYFQDVTTRMGCNYTPTTRRTTYTVEGLYGGTIRAELNPGNQGRFIEFAITSFCEPEQIDAIYSPQNRAELRKKIIESGITLPSKWQEWMTKA